MSMVSENPNFSNEKDVAVNIDEADVAELSSPATGKSPSRAKKIILGLGAIAVTGAAFAGGYLAAPRTTVTSGTAAGSGDASVGRAQTLEDIYQAHPDLGKITPSVLGELVEQYELDPAGWDDTLVPKEFLALLSEAKTEEFGDRRLLSTGSEADRKALYSRQLDRDFDFPYAQNAWSVLESEDYSDAVRSNDDKIAVKRSGSTCVLVSEESNSLEDWVNNLDLGDEDVLSINKYNQRDEACGCEKKTWWWCSTYKSCPVYKVVGEGFDGFAKPWNAMRLAVWNQMNSKCSGVSSYHFYGYSRGGAIVALMAAALKKEGVIPANQIQVVTFGAPRVLEKGFSDDVHNDFETLRLVNKKDPVPSLPYGWMGYRHYGTMACRACGYPEERDRPNFSWIVDGVIDHTQYGDWF